MKSIYKSALISGALILGAHFSRGENCWNNVQVKKETNSFAIKANGKLLGRVGTWKQYREDLKLVEIRGVDGKLVIDTRKFHQANPKGTILLYKDFSGIQPGKKISVDFEILSGPVGGKVRLFLEGATAARKHFYKEKKSVISKGGVRENITAVLPDDLKNLHYRVDMGKGGVYEIGTLSYTYPQPKEVDGQENQIINGGAERNAYNVYPDSRYTGIRSDSPELIIDTKTVHSGKKSFCLVDTGTSSLRFYFAPIQFYTGRPVSFSCWMKTDGKAKVDLLLYAASGRAYSGSSQKVGNEWQKISFSVPEVGKKQVTKGRVIGRPETTAERPFGGNLIAPRINIFGLKKGEKIWIDDAVVQYSTETDAFKVKKLSLSGALDNPKGYYVAGEAVSGSMRLEGEVSDAEISYQLLDGFGKIAKKYPAQKVRLPYDLKFKITPPENLRGLVNLLFTMTSGKLKQRAGLHFGIINPPSQGKMNKRFGINLSSYFDHKDGDVDYLLPIMKDFHIGAVRLWSSGGAFKYAHKFKGCGIFTLLCLSSPDPGKLWLLNDYSDYLKEIGPHVHALRGKIDAYEIFNEPNIWSGRGKNPDPSKFCDADIHAVVKATKIIASFLKQNDPSALIVGPGCCGTKADYICQYLRLGAGKFIDAVSQHSYRNEPENPDYGADLRELKNAIKEYGKKLPIYDTESGSVSTLQFPDNLIPESSRRAAAHDLRMGLIGIANGIESFMQFYATSYVCGNSYGADLIASDYANGSRALPGVYLYAARAVGDLIGDTRKIVPVKLGLDYRCYTFDRGDKRVAAIWKWRGKPSLMKLPQNFSVMDMFGTKCSTSQFELGVYPHFIETELSGSELTRILQKARSGIVSGTPVDFSVRLKDEIHAEVVIRNCGSTPLSGEVKFGTSGQVKSFTGIPAEEKRSLVFKLEKKLSTAAQDCPVRVVVPALKWTQNKSIKLRGLIVPYFKEKLHIDGDLKDWPFNARTVVLDRKNACRKGEWTKEEENITADLKFVWNEERLYAAVIVHKDSFNPPHLSSQSLWQGDSLQIAFDTVQNAIETTPKYQNDDIEYALGQFKGAPVVYRAVASSPNYDSLLKPLGVVKDVEMAIKHMPDKTVYEIAFPRYSVSPFQLKPGSSCRFDLIVNLNNGKRRIGWLELTPGIGQFKRPGLFMPMVLSK